MNSNLIRRLHELPFSCRGSWICFFRKNPGKAGGSLQAPLSLRVIAGVIWEDAEIFDLDLERKGIPLSWDEKLSPELLTLATHHGIGAVQIAFQDASTVRLRAAGVTLRLSVCKGESVELGKGLWRVKAASLGWVLLQVVSGSICIERQNDRSTVVLNGETESAEILVHRTTSAGVPPPACGSLEDCVAARRRELELWRKAFPVPLPRWAQLFEREANNLWNLTVAPLGMIRRELTLVSKGSLIGLWSWDHCWHMLGNAAGDSVLAWNNFLAMFDHQDELGGLPDMITANQIAWGHLKPPVHGWMLSLLEQRIGWFNDEHRRQAYEPLARWTRFWLTQRDSDGDGVPNFNTGCDSGWDNATLFDSGMPVESPDLSVWLILQQEWLAKTARLLGDEAEALCWEEGAARLTQKMLEHFWTGERFVARLSGSHQEVSSESLLLLVPLLLGSRLPQAARDWCLESLLEKGRYRCAFGILSEPADSPRFVADGYWQGAMWPVTVFIFVEALRANGRAVEAESLATDFLTHLERVGNFENYRGDNGVGVRDAAIAWTSTVALLLIDSLSQRDA